MLCSGINEPTIWLVISVISVPTTKTSALITTNQAQFEVADSTEKRLFPDWVDSCGRLNFALRGVETQQLRSLSIEENMVSSRE